LKELAPTGNFASAFVVRAGGLGFSSVTKGPPAASRHGVKPSILGQRAWAQARRTGGVHDGSNSGLVTRLPRRSGAVDVSFMPVDEERKKAAWRSGPPYIMIESTYLATRRGPASRRSPRSTGPASASSGNRQHHRRSAPLAATPEEHHDRSPATLGRRRPVALLREGEKRTCSPLFSRELRCRPFVAMLPGSRIVDGGFQQTGHRHRRAQDPAAKAARPAITFVHGRRPKSFPGVRPPRPFDGRGLRQRAGCPVSQIAYLAVRLPRCLRHFLELFADRRLPAGPCRAMTARPRPAALEVARRVASAGGRRCRGGYWRAHGPWPGAWTPAEQTYRAVLQPSICGCSAKGRRTTTLLLGA